MKAKILATTLLLLATGCAVTTDDVDVWKGTVKGPRKMVAVMLADKYEIGLRTYSGFALVEMDRQDVSGIDELLEALDKLDENTRNSIIDGLTPQLVELMSRAGTGGSDGPPTHQIRAKDAAFVLIEKASDDSKAKLTDAVIGWYTADFNGRSLSGRYSAEQVVLALGSTAAARLVDALGAKLPQQALVKLAELIGQLGQPAAKKRAAEKLVAIETEMESEAFLNWLKVQIKEQLEAANEKPDAKRIDRTALINREKFINQGALPAMKHLADQEEVAGRLLQIAATPNAKLALRRSRALQALEGRATEKHLDQLLALALDAASPAAVRDYAFDRVGDIRSPKAIPPMWALVQDAENQRLRWRAGELVLAIGGNGVLAEFFAKLPVAEGIKYEPEELEGYAQRMAQMTPLPRDVAKAQLGSPDWWDQVIALRFFERKGTEADVASMEQLSKSAVAVAGKNWGKVTTVGKVAQEAIAGLRERLKLASAGKDNKKSAT